MLNYFGTMLRGAGHYIFKMEEEIMYDRSLNFKGLPFDPEKLPIPRMPVKKGHTEFYKIEGYSIFRIEGSCADTRWGTKSVFWLHEDLTEDELIERIKRTPIAMRIINAMPFEVEKFTKQHSEILK